MTPRLILLGPRGSGKTTVGHLVAERLSVPFADVDDLVQRDAGMTIAAIFDREGEPGFRDREAAALRSAVEAGGVIATGGGVVVRRESRELLKSLACPRVLLTADAATLHARVAADAASRHTRPALTELQGVAEVEHLLREREALYREVATHVVDVTKATDDVVQQIVRLTSR